MKPLLLVCKIYKKKQKKLKPRSFQLLNQTLLGLVKDTLGLYYSSYTDRGKTVLGNVELSENTPKKHTVSFLLAHIGYNCSSYQIKFDTNAVKSCGCSYHHLHLQSGWSMISHPMQQEKNCPANTALLNPPLHSHSGLYSGVWMLPYGQRTTGITNYTGKKQKQREHRKDSPAQWKM